MNGWILDVIFFALLLLGIMFGTHIGLVRGICRLAGMIFSLAVAFIFCIAFSNTLESWFGLQTALENGIGNATLAGWISIAISFVSLAVLVRLGAWLVGKLGTALVDRVKPAAAVNKALGGILGGIEALLAIFLLLVICYWIGAAPVDRFIDSSFVVSAIYRWDWFIDVAHLKIW